MISTELPKLLYQYGINNWKYHDDANELSVVVLTPSKIGVKTTQYTSTITENELTIVGDIDSDYDSIIQDLKVFIIKNNKRINSYISLLAKISQFKYKDIRKKYQTSVRGSCNLSEIREYGFSVTDQWITWNNYIPINMIIYHNDKIDVDSEEMKNLGYGVTSFKVVNDFNFRNGIYCEGLHPNVSMTSKKFCSESNTNRMVVNLDNLIIIKGLLSHINMDHPYNPQIHMDTLKQFIQEKLYEC